MLENLEVQQYIRECRVRTVLGELDAKDAKHLQNYLDDQVKWSAYGLAKALRPRGVSLDPKAIARHRDNLCTCRLLNNVG